MLSTEGKQRFAFQLSAILILSPFRSSVTASVHVIGVSTNSLSAHMPGQAHGGGDTIEPSELV